MFLVSGYDKYPRKTIKKEEGFIWRMVSEVSVHSQQDPVLWAQGKVLHLEYLAKTAYLKIPRKWRNRRHKGQSPQVTHFA